MQLSILTVGWCGKERVGLEGVVGGKRGGGGRKRGRGAGRSEECDMGGGG